MFFAVCAIALLCWMSAVSHSAPPACEDLVRPLDQLDPHHLEGKWALVAGSLSHPPHLEKFKKRDSASVNFSTNDTYISYTRSIRLDNKCQYNTYNISLEGSSFSYDGTDKSNFSANLVHTTCQDCLLMRFNVESGKRLHFYLFSRRRELEQSEVEEFRAQVECLKIPPPVVMDPTKELCPEETAGDPAAKTEEKTEGQKD
ncbi:alpha-1-acid glycoprotein 1-like [Pempheris klunzingeri]|uniref:alpha-1-acid glycoprotein 1-like n=1 Tax=Pempheris klunzingeri TaxID=3127111 RepID=UPI00397FCC09